MSHIEDLTKLAALRDRGALTEEEFAAEKARLLSGDTAGSKPSPAGPRPRAPLNPAVFVLAGLGALMLIVIVVVLVTRVDGGGGDAADPGISARAKTSEAIDMLDKIYKGASIYYSTPYLLKSGMKVPCQFPTNQGVTPVEGTCCSSNGLGGPDNDKDDRCDSNPALWGEITWSELRFQINDQHYFTYAFDAEGTLSDASFRATANADLDCDSIQSTFQRVAFGDPQATHHECSLRGAPAIYVEQETE